MSKKKGKQTDNSGYFATITVLISKIMRLSRPEDPSRFHRQYLRPCYFRVFYLWFVGVERVVVLTS